MPRKISRKFFRERALTASEALDMLKPRWTRCLSARPGFVHAPETSKHHGIHDQLKLGE